MTQLSDNSVALLERDLSDLNSTVQSDIRIKMYEAASLEVQAANCECKETKSLLLVKSSLAFLASVRIEDRARSSLEHRLASNKILSKYKGVQLLFLELLYIAGVSPVRYQIHLTNRLVLRLLCKAFYPVRTALLYLWR